MSVIYVQFSDDVKSSICSVFSCPQDGTAFPNQGQVTEDDPLYAAFYASQPPTVQRGLPTPTMSSN